MNSDKTLIDNTLIEDYKKIFDDKNLKEKVSKMEWQKNGDFFKKFSMYENYSPVKTSGETILISQL